LQGQSFAAVALAVQVVVPDEHHVARLGAALGLHRARERQRQADHDGQVQGIAHGRVFYALKRSLLPARAPGSRWLLG
jgi:hypothetical protein